MNLKNIILAGLLLPACCLGNMLEHLTLEQLQEKQYQKLLEIRELRKIISEGDEYIRHGILMCASLYIRETNESYQAMCNEITPVCTELIHALLGRQEFKRSLFDELFDMEKIGSVDIFNSYKFLDVSIPLEQELMIFATIKYEICVQELIKLNKAVFDLVGKGTT